MNELSLVISVEVMHTWSTLFYEGRNEESQDEIIYKEMVKQTG